MTSSLHKTDLPQDNDDPDKGSGGATEAPKHEEDEDASESQWEDYETDVEDVDEEDQDLEPGAEDSEVGPFDGLQAPKSIAEKDASDKDQINFEPSVERVDVENQVRRLRAVVSKGGPGDEMVAPMGEEQEDASSSDWEDCEDDQDDQHRAEDSEEGSGAVLDSPNTGFLRPLAEIRDELVVNILQTDRDLMEFRHIMVQSPNKVVKGWGRRYMQIESREANLLKRWQTLDMDGLKDFLEGPRVIFPDSMPDIMEPFQPTLSAFQEDASDFHLGEIDTDDEEVGLEHQVNKHSVAEPEDNTDQLVDKLHNGDINVVPLMPHIIIEEKGELSDDSVNFEAIPNGKRRLDARFAIGDAAEVEPQLEKTILEEGESKSLQEEEFPKERRQKGRGFWNRIRKAVLCCVPCTGKRCSKRDKTRR